MAVKPNLLGNTIMRVQPNLNLQQSNPILAAAQQMAQRRKEQEEQKMDIFKFVQAQEDRANTLRRQEASDQLAQDRWAFTQEQAAADAAHRKKQVELAEEARLLAANNAATDKISTLSDVVLGVLGETDDYVSYGKEGESDPKITPKVRKLISEGDLNKLFNAVRLTDEHDQARVIEQVINRFRTEVLSGPVLYPGIEGLQTFQSVFGTGKPAKVAQAFQAFLKNTLDNAVQSNYEGNEGRHIPGLEKKPFGLEDLSEIIVTPDNTNATQQ
jgi:hypothetical protein